MQRYLGVVMVVLATLSGCFQPASVQEMSKGIWTPEIVSTPEMEQVWSWIDPKENKPGMSHQYFMHQFDDQEIEARQTGAAANFDLKSLLKAVKDEGF